MPAFGSRGRGGTGRRGRPLRRTRGRKLRSSSKQGSVTRKSCLNLEYCDSQSSSLILNQNREVKNLIPKCMAMLPSTSIASKRHASVMENYMNTVPAKKRFGKANVIPKNNINDEEENYDDDDDDDYDDQNTHTQTHMHYDDDIDTDVDDDNSDERPNYTYPQHCRENGENAPNNNWNSVLNKKVLVQVRKLNGLENRGNCQQNVAAFSKEGIEEPEIKSARSINRNKSNDNDPNETSSNESIATKNAGKKANHHCGTNEQQQNNITRQLEESKFKQQEIRNSNISTIAKISKNKSTSSSTPKTRMAANIKAIKSRASHFTSIVSPPTSPTLPLLPRSSKEKAATSKNIFQEDGTLKTICRKTMLLKNPKEVVTDRQSRGNPTTENTKNVTRLDNSRRTGRLEHFGDGDHIQKSQRSGLNANESSTQTVLKSIINRDMTNQAHGSLSTMPHLEVQYFDSIKFGESTFKWLINPLSTKEFFDKFWETKATLIKRHDPTYFQHLASFGELDEALLNNCIEYTTHLDITSYTNGVRETLNPDGRAMPPMVWNFYSTGCSIRLLNPQVYFPKLYTLNSVLQEFFHCLVGSNLYLTPPNSQGFAPHYDDIEAFVLQIEGKKRWTLYKPTTAAEALPRFSSGNLTQADCGEIIFDEVVEAGDMLYFPRGTIHQAHSLENTHSLHITLSMYQKQSYGDLMESLLPILLEKCIDENIDLRRGVPRDIWYHTGVAHSRRSTSRREEILKYISNLLYKISSGNTLVESIDKAVDEMGVKFQCEALPPCILPGEINRTVFGSRSYCNESGDCFWKYKIDLNTSVRLLRANIIQLSRSEKDAEKPYNAYFYVDNSKNYGQYETNCIELDEDGAINTEMLINVYPKYISVGQLPKLSKNEKISYATLLWERGILMMEEPFQNN